MKSTKRQANTSLRKRLTILTVTLISLYGLLLWPDASPDLPAIESSEAFLWDRDAYWSHLENQFVQARTSDSLQLNNDISTQLASANALLDSCQSTVLTPDSPVLAQLETTVFELGPVIAARVRYLPQFIQFQNRLRLELKEQSQNWNMSSGAARDRLYRLLYGCRTAVEEVMLQVNDNIPPLIMATDEPSATPSAPMLGVTLHSGDILVSRGGAPTSALIARGNDYPGNFSHVALVHVNETSRKISIIEAHIEIGVAVADVTRYLMDTKLRVLVLRLRADHQALVADPMLPHKAASMALDRALREHIAYDFAMDYEDNSKLFCSEVASAPYSQLGVTLWMGISHISSPGVQSWLAAFGVRHFVTQEPSDLEYDPQLRVVAEWRDPETLWKDHLDNAVIDAMLERAETGDRLNYDWYLLPVGRLLKGYSMINNLFGHAGPVPEGMSATSALTNDWFSRRHATVKSRVIELAHEFGRNNRYRPPYWELVKLARTALDHQQ